MSFLIFCAEVAETVDGTEFVEGIVLRVFFIKYLGWFIGAWICFLPIIMSSCSRAKSTSDPAAPPSCSSSSKGACEPQNLNITAAAKEQQGMENREAILSAMTQTDSGISSEEDIDNSLQTTAQTSQSLNVNQNIAPATSTISTKFNNFYVCNGRLSHIYYKMNSANNGVESQFRIIANNVALKETKEEAALWEAANTKPLEKISVVRNTMGTLDVYYTGGTDNLVYFTTQTSGDGDWAKPISLASGAGLPTAFIDTDEKEYVYAFDLVKWVPYKWLKVSSTAFQTALPDIQYQAIATARVQNGINADQDGLRIFSIPTPASSSSGVGAVLGSIVGQLFSGLITVGAAWVTNTKNYDSAYSDAMGKLNQSACP